MDFVRVDLPIDLVESKVKDLIAGGGVLSSEVLRQWSVNAIWTAAPPGVPLQELVDVTRGGLTEPSRLNPFITSFVRQFLEVDRRHLALFEDAVVRPGDPVLLRAQSQYALIGENVLPLLVGDGHNNAAVATLLLEAWSWRLVGVLTRTETKPIVHRLDAIVSRLVADSKHILVGAWDGEGLLVADRS